ncbi:MAG TPA: hypothetical protein VEH83_02700 [Gemmatimonadales bacterium]|nr:hypothetical protein [Gemmatimonadales bacterium]
MKRAAGLLLALVASAGPAARAQEVREPARTVPPRLTITLARDSAAQLLPPVVRAERLLDDGVFDGALRNGFSVRFHFRLELWRQSPLFDRLQGGVEWDAVVRLDPLSGEFDLIRTGGDVTHLTAMDAVSRALARAFTVEMTPPATGPDTRYYYLATLDIASLSQSDLDEVERWLRGDVGPAISSRGGLGGALAVGARRLLIRLSGLPHRRLEARTPTFTAGR